MFSSKVVQRALNNTLSPEMNQGTFKPSPVDDQSSLTSLLIHDIFGGEILKTHKKRGWHFYNRIEGKRIDLSNIGKRKSTLVNKFEDLPVAPDETFFYFDEVEYSVFLTKFLMAFEQIVGLKKSNRILFN